MSNPTTIVAQLEAQIAEASTLLSQLETRKTSVAQSVTQERPRDSKAEPETTPDPSGDPEPTVPSTLEIKMKKSKGYGYLAKQINKQMADVPDWTPIQAKTLRDRMGGQMLWHKHYTFQVEALMGTAFLDGGVTGKSLKKAMRAGKAWRNGGREKYLAKKKAETAAREKAKARAEQAARAEQEAYEAHEAEKQRQLLEGLGQCEATPEDLVSPAGTADGQEQSSASRSQEPSKSHADPLSETPVDPYSPRDLDTAKKARLGAAGVKGGAWVKGQMASRLAGGSQAAKDTLKMGGSAVAAPLEAVGYYHSDNISTSEEARVGKAVVKAGKNVAVDAAFLKASASNPAVGLVAYNAKGTVDGAIDSVQAISSGDSTAIHNQADNALAGDYAPVNQAIAMGVAIAHGDSDAIISPEMQKRSKLIRTGVWLGDKTADLMGHKDFMDGAREASTPKEKALAEAILKERGGKGKVAFKDDPELEAQNQARREKAAAEIAAAPVHDEATAAQVSEKIRAAARRLYPKGGAVDRDDLAAEAGVTVGEVRKHWG